LTVISGYNRMMMDDLAAQDFLRSCAEEILKAAERAAALTNQLLTFSRRQVTRPLVLGANALIRRIEPALRLLLAPEIELVLALNPDSGNIRVDPVQLEQAILNLVMNARDAMPAGGRLTMETGITGLDEAYTRTPAGVKPGEFVMIAVT